MPSKDQFGESQKLKYFCRDGSECLCTGTYRGGKNKYDIVEYNNNINENTAVRYMQLALLFKIKSNNRTYNLILK